MNAQWNTPNGVKLKCSPETWNRFRDLREQLGDKHPKTLGLRDEIFFSYRNLATAAANRYAAHCMPYRSLIEPDDIHRDAEIGLLEAVNAYDMSFSAIFSTFAYHRINGSIIDGIRSLQNFPRIISKIRRELTPVLQKLSHELGKNATVADLAESNPSATISGIPILQIASDSLVSVNVYNQESEKSNSDYDSEDDIKDCRSFDIGRLGRSYSQFDSMAFVDTVEKILRFLSDDKYEQRVIYCYFFLGMTSTAISRISKLSPTWVSEKKVSGLQKIRRECRNNPQFAEEILTISR